MQDGRKVHTSKQVTTGFPDSSKPDKQWYITVDIKVVLVGAS